MNAKLKNTSQSWVDPDDAPELTDAFLEQGVWKIGDRVVFREEGKSAMTGVVRRGHPESENPKMALTVWCDVAFKSTGGGWQTRMNAALRDWLRTHSSA